MSTNAVLNELNRKLTFRPDYITLSGSGEPTLHSGLGEIIERIRGMTAVPVAVLTNGSLLWQKAVRKEVALADVVLPSLDPPDAERFKFNSWKRTATSAHLSWVTRRLRDLKDCSMAAAKAGRIRIARCNVGQK